MFRVEYVERQFYFNFFLHSVVFILHCVVDSDCANCSQINTSETRSIHINYQEIHVCISVYLHYCLYPGSQKETKNKHAEESVRGNSIMFAYCSKMKKVGSFKPFNDYKQCCIDGKRIITY